MIARYWKIPALILASSAALLLSSCASLLETGSQPERTFWLEPLVADVAQTDMAGPVLTVRVTVIPGLDTDHLVTIGPGPELNRISGARWPGALPEHISSLLIRSLAASGNYARVTRDAGAKRQACDLELEIEKFYTRLGNARSPQAVEISMAGIFNCGASVHPLRVEQRQAVAGARITDVVAAHQQALDAITRDLLERLAKLREEADEKAMVPPALGNTHLALSN